MDGVVPPEIARGPLAAEAEVAVRAALAAGECISAAFLDRDKGEAEKAGQADLVTATDRQAEARISALIKQAFPEHEFIGEEQESNGGASSVLTDTPTWMCDPLDGTTNFVHAFPLVCVSIALVVERRIVVGVVFNPVLRELFVAARGCGAYLNGRRLAVSSQGDLSRALLLTEVGISREPRTLSAVFGRMQALTARARGLRCCGSCALDMCSVACGRADAFYELKFGGCWDVAAGALLVEEAGGVVLDPSGAAFDVMACRVLASNKHLAPVVVAALAEYDAQDQQPQQQQQAGDQ